MKLRNFLSKLIVFIFCSVIVLQPISTVADTDKTESERSARAIGNVIIDTEGDGRTVNGVNGYYAGDTDTLSISLLPLSTKREPVVITVSDGAKITVDPATGSNFGFTVGGSPGKYTSLLLSSDKSTLTFYAENLEFKKVANIRLGIIAPTNASSFRVTAKVGATSAAPIYFPMFSRIEVSAPSVVTTTEYFTITGKITKSTPLVKGVAHLEIVNKSGTTVVDKNIATDALGRYTFYSNRLITSGQYKVIVTAMDKLEYMGQVIQYIDSTKTPMVKGIYYRIYSDRGLDFKGTSPVIFDKVTTNSLYDPLSQLTAEITLDNTKDIRSAVFEFDTGYGIYTYGAIVNNNVYKVNLTRYKINKNAVLNLIITKTDNSTQKIKVGDVKVYIDPAGYIYDLDTGAMIEGAEVTLYHRHPLLTDNEWVPWDLDSSQANPILTGKDGVFNWLVSPGEYEVRVFHKDYFYEGDYYTTLMDENYGPIVVPPERVDVFIGLRKLSYLRTIRPAIEDTFINFVPAQE